MRNPAATALRMSVDQLVEAALQYSSYVHVVSVEPRIRQTAIVEEQAAFDWRAFLETTYTDLNEPVGNILTTGTLEDRYKDQTWSTTGDSAVRTFSAAMWTCLSAWQRGKQLPLSAAESAGDDPAGTALHTAAAQRCRAPYNESRIVLARIHTEISSDQLAAELEEHLIKVTEAYWELYRARAEYFQRQKLVDSAQATLAILEARRGRRRTPTSTPARAAVTTRMSEIVRAGRRFATPSRGCGCWSTIRPWCTRRVASSLRPMRR